MYVKYNNIVASFLTSNLRKGKRLSDERLYIRVVTELRSRLQVAAASAGLKLNQYVNSLLESGGVRMSLKQWLLSFCMIYRRWFQIMKITTETLPTLKH
ncbi:toxin-antitoxin system HicB family antitoxin [Enterobacter cloacae]|uniref:toxin-antitoxin system HicB family antitoxin n=1 Tax=Enterobacter cloacae TaxID=550 RepID=UPI00388DED36